MTASDEPAIPKVTPYMLRRAAELCARRLAAELGAEPGSGDPVNRARLRGAFLDAARAAHADGGPPRLERLSAPGFLEPEERAVFDRASTWYGQLYGDRAVRTHLHDCDSPTLSPRRGVRIGGWVDLTVTGDGEGAEPGPKELRQLDLWGGRLPGTDPLDLESVWVAVLRLARWVGDDPLLVSWADLVRGEHRERLVHVADELPDLAARFDVRLDVVRSRAASPDAAPGTDCGECRHLWRCPAHPGAINVSARSGDLRPGVITLTPTSLDTWNRCVRAWRNQYLLSIPASDESSSPDHGRRLHDVLRFLHERGSCADRVHVDDVLDAHGADDRLRDEIARHARRCPAGSASSVGHELDFARFHRDPWPPFMATARVDAVWEHDGVLDVRDYKTGRLWYPLLAEDPRARLQAWVVAPAAARRGLRLRLRYEHLAAEVDEDAEPWEPDDDELAAVEAGLHATVAAMRAETDWHGVAEEGACRHCRYRSICPDSAAVSRPDAFAPVPGDGGERT